MRVRIDRARCQGHARCAALAPALFELDDDGYGFEADAGFVPIGAENEARRAASGCPEQAVVIEDAT